MLRLRRRFVQSPLATGYWSRVTCHFLLKNERDQPFYAPLIGAVFVGEFLEHEFFFVTQFDPQTAEDERQGDDSSDVAKDDHGSDNHHEDAGVDRMAHEGIRPAGNQFVTAVECDETTPA